MSLGTNYFKKKREGLWKRGDIGKTWSPFKKKKKHKEEEEKEVSKEESTGD